MFGKIYESSIIEKPKFTLLVLIILLLSFGYFADSFVHGDSPGKNTGVGYHFPLQGIFPTQG